METHINYSELIEGAIIFWAIIGGAIGALVALISLIDGDITGVFWLLGGVVGGAIYGIIAGLGISLLSWLYLGAYKLYEDRKKHTEVKAEGIKVEEDKLSPSLIPKILILIAVIAVIIFGIVYFVGSNTETKQSITVPTLVPLVEPLQTITPVKYTTSAPSPQRIVTGKHYCYYDGNIDLCVLFSDYSRFTALYKVVNGDDTAAYGKWTEISPTEYFVEWGYDVYSSPYPYTTSYYCADTSCNGIYEEGESDYYYELMSY